jgi:pimeloyl-ACP methyl ester carboxylesterase
MFRTNADAAAADDPDARLRADPAVFDALDAMFTEAFRQGVAGFRDDWIATFAPWGFALADVRRPVDLWRGDADAMSSAAHTAALESAFGTRATMHAVAGGGHLIPITNWADILESLLSAGAAARAVDGS